jgi:LPS O-antigen subunit length determinant protein (WzzB/FepE family)
MKGKTTTIEGLAVFIHETMASKEDITELQREMNQQFGEVRSRLDRIEHLLLEEQKRKIENLETRMKKLEDALAVKPHVKGRQTIADQHLLSLLSPYLTQAWGVPFLHLFPCPHPPLTPSAARLCLNTYGKE